MVPAMQSKKQTNMKTDLNNLFFGLHLHAIVKQTGVNNIQLLKTCAMPPNRTNQVEHFIKENMQMAACFLSTEYENSGKASGCLVFNIAFAYGPYPGYGNVKHITYGNWKVKLFFLLLFCFL